MNNYSSIFVVPFQIRREKMKTNQIHLFNQSLIIQQVNIRVMNELEDFFKKPKKTWNSFV